VFGAIREVQIPLLAALLLGGCLAKLGHVLRSRSVAVALGPTALFPLRLRRPVAMAMCAAELALGIALIATASRAGPGLAATAARGATAVLFLTAAGALIELRQRRPDVGCGCFGDLSSAPVTLRTIARSALLALAAIGSIGVAPLHLPPPGAALALRLGVLAAELALIAVLSPEIGEALTRLGYSEPCELRVLPVQRTLSALRGSRQWRKHAPVITGNEPVDVWREVCWRYLVYPGSYGGRAVEVVFAVYLRPRRPAIRAAVVDAATGDVLPPLTVLPPAAGQPVRPLPPHPVGLWPAIGARTAAARPAAGPGPGTVLRPAAGPGAVAAGGSATGPLVPPAQDEPQFLPAATVAELSATPGSLYSLLALSTPVPRERHNHEEAPERNIA
jgi:hypothetical protein